MSTQQITRFFTITLFIAVFHLYSHAQIGFGTSIPDSSAIVHIQDTTKGLLIPRMTTTQKNNIHHPAEGLVIYQTDSATGFWYHTCGQWVPFFNNHKHTLILTGDITNSEAAEKIAREVGPVTQEIRIYDCDNLTSVDLSMLTGITELYVSNNPVMQTINLSKLKTVDAGINISQCPVLSNINLSLLETVGNRIEFAGTGLAGINLSLLKKAVWGISYASNPNLQSVSLPLLMGPSTRMMDFQVVNNSSLVSISAPLLSKADHLSIRSNKNCTSLNLPILSNVNILEIVDDSLLTVASFPSLTMANQINIQKDSLLTSVSFPLLTTAGSLDIRRMPALTTFSFPVLATANSIYMAYLNNLTVLSMPLLTSVNYPYLSISSCKNLSAINLPLLASVRSFSVADNINLSTVSVPSLAIAGTIYFNSNPSCAALNFSALTALTGIGITPDEVNISYCTNLSSVSFPNLTTIQSTRLNFSSNKFSSSQVNTLLNKFATITPLLTGKDLWLFYQNPLAPPTGQGIIDKATLIANGNSVGTD